MFYFYKSSSHVYFLQLISLAIQEKPFIQGNNFKLYLSLSDYL